MGLKEIVFEWLQGTTKLQEIIFKIKSKQIPQSSDRQILNVIKAYAMLSICPNISSKFAAAFSRNRSNKVNLAQTLVSSVVQFNKTRAQTLQHVYKTLSGCSDEYCKILKVLEHSTQVKCTAMHDVGTGTWSSYASKILITCTENVGKKRSWVMHRSSIVLFKSFFRIRHFHEEIGMITRWWMQSRSIPTTLSTTHSDVLKFVQEFNESESAALLHNYRKSSAELQRCMYTYI